MRLRRPKAEAPTPDRRSPLRRGTTDTVSPTRRTSMRRRLLLSHLSITLLVLIILEVPLALFFARVEQDRLVADVERDAVVLGSFYEDALDQGGAFDLQAARNYASRFGARVLVTDERGISIVDTGGVVPRDFSTRPEVADALAGSRSVSGTRFSATLNTELLYVAVPVASGGEVHGAVRVTLNTESLDAKVRRFWLSLVALGVVALGAVAIVSLSISGSVIGPVRRIGSAADRLATGDLRARIDPEDAPRELHELSISFNRMADRLNELLDTQRSFVADASHQLRTPLTALRLQLENAEAETADAATRNDLNAAIGEVGRLDQLINELLALAQAEGRRTSLEPVDLVAAVNERAELWRGIADESDVTVSVALPGTLSALAAPGAVEQILDNLIDNAIGHTPAGATVELTGEVVSSGRVRINVVDHGPGLSDEDRQRAFDRFWRGDQDRPGSGLGLPIVAQLAASSGGSVALSETPGGGLTASVDLPSTGQRRR